MTGRLRRWWNNHWQAWTCLHGWNRVVCIADDLAHILHLPGMVWLCELYDRRLMHAERAGAWTGFADMAGTTAAPQQWNTSTSTVTTTVGDAKFADRSPP